MVLRPGTAVTVTAYCLTLQGYVTDDKPMPHHVRAGRVIPVRLKDGPLRFHAREDVHPTQGGEPS